MRDGAGRQAGSAQRLSAAITRGGDSGGDSGGNSGDGRRPRPASRAIHGA
ncbi:hypothetical protein C7S15_7418 [Burkholderia cepacia]|nr:hypothetical protein [Burkholderia cepacia]